MGAFFSSVPLVTFDLALVRAREPMKIEANPGFYVKGIAGTQWWCKIFTQNNGIDNQSLNLPTTFNRRKAINIYKRFVQQETKYTLVNDPSTIVNRAKGDKLSIIKWVKCIQHANHYLGFFFKDNHWFKTLTTMTGQNSGKYNWIISTSFSLNGCWRRNWMQMKMDT